MTRIAFWLLIFAAADLLTERVRTVHFSLDGLGDPFDIWGDEGDA